MSTTRVPPSVAAVDHADCRRAHRLWAPRLWRLREYRRLELRVLRRRDDAAGHQFQQRRRVLTVPGFSVTAGGNALEITGNGALSYTDTNASPLIGHGRGAVYAITGDDGLAPGSITVNTNGVLTGGFEGIFARNYGSGALNITANGDVTGTAYSASLRGIMAPTSA